MKKKWILILLISALIGSTVSYAWATWANLAVRRLAPAAALATGSGGIKIPAYIGGLTSAGLTAYGWVALALPGATVAAVAGAALAVAGSATLDYVMNNAPEWFASKNYVNDGDGISKRYTTTYPTGYDPANYNTDTSEMVSSGSEAAIMCGMHRQYYTGPCNQGSSVCQQWTGNPDANLIYWWCKNAGATTNFTWFYPKPGVPQDPPVINDVPVPLGGVLADLLTDINADNANALKVGQAGLEVAANALDDPNHPLNQDAAQRAAIAAAFAAAISQGQKDNLEANAAAYDDTTAGNLVKDNDIPVTPAQIAAAVKQALEGQGLNAAQIAAAIAAAQQAAVQGLTQAQAQAAVEAALASAGVNAAGVQSAVAAALTAAGLATNAGVETAVKNAIDDETGVTPPVDTDPLIPDKLSLTSVLESFVTAIQQLPIMQTLQGLTINTSGTSVLSLTFLGQTYSYDVGGMQGALNTIGSALLGLTTIFSFLGIFRS